MENHDFNLLQQEVQKIIDLIAAKNGKEANNKLVEISRYQVLLNQLHQKINELN